MCRTDIIDFLFLYPIVIPIMLKPWTEFYSSMGYMAVANSDYKNILHFKKCRVNEFQYYNILDETFYTYYIMIN